MFKKRVIVIHQNFGIGTTIRDKTITLSSYSPIRSFVLKKHYSIAVISVMVNVFFSERGVNFVLIYICILKTVPYYL